MTPLNEGDAAPDFSLPTDDGATVTLSMFKGRKLVLYFYPRDSTPGCTTEAREFSERLDAFTATDAVVVGVSKDSLRKHETFRAKQDLKIRLASDINSDVCERYGVWSEKKMYGKSFMGIQRATFLIDREGRIARIWPKVKVKGHADEVLEAARAAS